jgi:UDP-glucose 4-epimerase
MEERSPRDAALAFTGASALVTGGAGFIGSHLTEALLAAGADRVVVIDDLSLGNERNLEAVAGRIEFVAGDCADLELLRSVTGDGPFDYCFNLAVIPLPASLVRPRETVDANVAMTTAICELGRSGAYGRLVQFSSSEVYGTAREVPMPEGHPLHPHTPYAASKAATDLLALSYRETYGLEVLLVRPFNTYGPRQNEGSYAGLIPAVMRAVREERPVVIDGDGDQTRDYTYVSDVVEGTLALADSTGAVGRVVNLGYGGEVSVKQVVAALLEGAGRPDHPVTHGPARPGDVRRLHADVQLARELVAYEPRVELEDGLRLTAEWYLSGERAVQAD